MKLTLLDPASWDDRNDSHYIELYKQKKRLGSVLALCFTEAGETYHHWKVFSSGTSGVCVRFKKDLLLAHLEAKTSIRAGSVQYKMMDHLRTSTVDLASLPFLKRYAFRDEREFRLLYDTKNTLKSKDFSFPVECIDRVTINPWLNVRLADAIFDTVRSLKGCVNLSIGQSSLVNNNEWKRLGASAA